MRQIGSLLGSVLQKLSHPIRIVNILPDKFVCPWDLFRYDFQRLYFYNERRDGRGRLEEGGWRRGVGGGLKTGAGFEL